MISDYLHETIGQFVELHQAGNRLVGICPFHEEHSPSFTVDPKANTFHCFGCEKHGHAEDFVLELQRTRGVHGA